MPTARSVVVTLYDGLQPLDVVGPHEVLAGANQALEALDRDDPRYDLRLAAPWAGPIATPSGLRLLADHALADLDSAAIDTILVPGGDAAIHTDDHAPVVGWLRGNGPRARRRTTVCSGTFLAAAAGWCEGRRVTTHWSRAGQLAAACPGADVEPDAIYVRDGDLWTSAGVTAGIDLALALVEDDLGAEVAQLVARHLVVHLRRPGGQTQYAAPVWSEPGDAGPISAARDRIHAEPSADLSVPALAAAVGLSERHLARRFRAEVGESPARYVERVRVEAARHILETTSAGLDEVARRSGLGSAETLRRAFHRRLGCPPDAYRRRAATTRPA